MVGQAGILQGLLIITLANVVTALSAISMSAISTNGQGQHNPIQNRILVWSRAKVEWQELRVIVGVHALWFKGDRLRGTISKF